MKNANIINIDIRLIDTLPQVRKTFKEEKIAELAADIAEHGILQPLVVQQTGDRFTLLIGERRLRAIKYMAGETAPCIIATVAPALANHVQLMENIQREDLNTKDLAEAIKGLWESFGSAAEVAKRCHKSPSWVSKRLALALGVGPATTALLDGNVKDVELLYQFKKLETLDPTKARQLVPAIITGQLNREGVIDWLVGVKDGTGDDDSNNLDLFKDQEQSKTETPPQPTSAAEIDTETQEHMEKLLADRATMLKALEQIAFMDKSLKPIQKAEKMRALALEALKIIE